MNEIYPTSSTRLKPHLKNIRLTLTSIGLHEIGGDNRAYFLSELTDALAVKYKAQYGANYKSILIYEKDNIMPIFQRKLSQEYANYVKSDTQNIKEFRIKLPEYILYNASKQLHVLVIRCVPASLLVTTELSEAIAKLNEHHNRVMFKENDNYVVHQMREKHVSGAQYKGGL